MVLCSLYVVFTWEDSDPLRTGGLKNLNSVFVFTLEPTKMISNHS